MNASLSPNIFLIITYLNLPHRLVDENGKSSMSSLSSYSTLFPYRSWNAGDALTLVLMPFFTVNGSLTVHNKTQKKSRQYWLWQFCISENIPNLPTPDLCSQVDPGRWPSTQGNTQFQQGTIQLDCHMTRLQQIQTYPSIPTTLWSNSYLISCHLSPPSAWSAVLLYFQLADMSYAGETYARFAQQSQSSWSQRVLSSRY